MTLTAAENLKDTWISIFRRKGGDGDYTRLFDNLAPSQRNMLLAEFRLEESELPVVGSVQNSRNWFILTTERLAWSIKDKRREVSVNAIRDAKADLRQLQRSDNSKLGLRQLQLVTMENLEYSIEWEPGSPLSGTWNILKNLGAKNRSAADKVR